MTKIEIYSKDNPNLKTSIKCYEDENGNVLITAHQLKLAKKRIGLSDNDEIITSKKNTFLLCPPPTR